MPPYPTPGRPFAAHVPGRRLQVGRDHHRRPHPDARSDARSPRRAPRGDRPPRAGRHGHRHDRRHRGAGHRRRRASRHLDGTWQESVTPTVFYPLFAGIATEERAHVLVERHLLDPKRFWGPYVVPSVARDDPAYCSGGTVHPGRLLDRERLVPRVLRPGAGPARHGLRRRHRLAHLLLVQRDARAGPARADLRQPLGRRPGGADVRHPHPARHQQRRQRTAARPHLRRLRGPAPHHPRQGRPHPRPPLTPPPHGRPRRPRTPEDPNGVRHRESPSPARRKRRSAPSPPRRNGRPAAARHRVPAPGGRADSA
ncbi:MGH1-like glycoside hydrolase domain-containing protein [Streptomyces sp. NPDC050560]|uniref:MGH1-like glycoside hydrolase domain-containing protein n=1 Tax=Streptomyces sp. NPDC050560 TaxID=3365630 RepID=UPI0037A2C92B